MAKTKKVILFLVEGITDQETLGFILAKLINTEEVQFEITNGDITSRYGVNGKNVKNIVWEYIKGSMNKNRYQKSDMKQIVHIIDTDGAFIPKENVLPSKTKRLQYGEEYIITKKVEKILERNEQKTELVQELKECSVLGGIPYQIYYFSRNIEHVLHNMSGELTKSEKMELADKFLDEYEEQPENLIHFLKNKEFYYSDDYKASWKFILEQQNSLKRYNNLGIFLNILQEK
jgi:hypothetical protein